MDPLHPPNLRQHRGSSPCEELANGVEVATQLGGVVLTIEDVLVSSTFPRIWGFFSPHVSTGIGLLSKITHGLPNASLR